MDTLPPYSRLPYRSTKALPTFLGLIALLLLLLAPMDLVAQSGPAGGRTLLVKLKPDAQQSAQVRGGLQGPTTGLKSFDKLNRQEQAIRMERVFPPAGKHEARHRRAGLDRWYRIVFADDPEFNGVITRYRLDAHVEKVERDHARRLFRGTRDAAAAPVASALTPDDPSFGSQWHYHNTGQGSGTADADIDLPEAWALTTGNPNVIVSVLDTGADADHPDLSGNLWVNPGEIAGNGVDDDNNGYVDDVNGWDFSDNDNDPNDTDGHGTHTAGTIAATTHNGLGVAGIAGGFGGGGARVMPLKIFENATDDIISQAFVYGADNGAVVSSNSWGGGDASSIIEEAIDYFIAQAGGAGAPMQGGVVVFAAGNDDSENAGWGYPASYGPVIGVAATEQSDRKADYSNYGTWVDISAPGTNVLSTVHNGGYDTYSGTSMACPHVAGVAALVASYAPGMTGTQVRANLLASADPIDSLNPTYAGKLGSGRLNALNALQAAVPPPPDNTPPDAVTNLAVTTTTATTATLSWTASGDDGGSGRASAYDIRYATAPISAVTFAAATAVPSPPAPQTAGAGEQFTVGGLQYSTTYYFAVKVFDEKNNASGVSNSPDGTTEAAPALTLSPGALTADLAAGDATTQTLTLSNNGAGTLDYALAIQYDGAASQARAVRAERPATNPAFRAEKEALRRSRRIPRAHAPIVLLGGGTYLVWDPDQLDDTGEYLSDALQAQGHTVDYTSAFGAITDLSAYDAVFVTLGMFPYNHALTRRQGNALAAYLDGGGNLYLEGGDTWAYDTPRAVHTYFGIDGLDDGFNDLYRVEGVGGSFADGLSYDYSDNPDYGEYVDQLASVAPAEDLMINPEAGYATAVSHDAGTYRTVGASFNVGALTDGGSTREELVAAIVSFFGGSGGGPQPTNWLGATPTAGTIGAGQQVAVSVSFTASGLEAGTYSATLQVTSNDPNAPTTPVSVTLNVSGDDGGGGDPPIVLPNPMLWLRADDLAAAAGDPVDTWLDASGRGHDAAQGDSFAWPAMDENGLNGLTAVGFDGIDDFLAIGNHADLNQAGPYTARTLVIAFRTGSDVTRRQVIYEQGGGTRGLNLYLDAGRVYVSGWNVRNDGDGTPWGPAFVVAPVTAGTPYVINLTFDADAGRLAGYLNGAAIGETSDIGPLYKHTGRIGLGGMYNGTRFHDRARGGNGFNFEGAIAEVMFYDTALTEGERAGVTTYLADRYFGGTFSTTAADDAPTTTAVEDAPTTPKGFVLEQNYPNPFNPATLISFQLPEAARVRLAVYDVLGREVRLLVNEVQSAGHHTVRWDGRDAAGSTASSGVYFAVMRAGSFTQSRTMMLMK